MQPHQQQFPRGAHPPMTVAPTQMYSSISHWGQANLTNAQAPGTAMWMNRQPQPISTGQTRHMMQVPLMQSRQAQNTHQTMGGIRTHAAAPSAPGYHQMHAQIQPSNGKPSGMPAGMDPRNGMEVKSCDTVLAMQPNPHPAQKQGMSQQSLVGTPSHNTNAAINAAKALPEIQKYAYTAAAAETVKKAPAPRKTLEINDESGLFESYISIHPGTNKLVIKGPAAEVSNIQIIAGPSSEQVEYIDTDKLDSGRLVALDFDQTIVKVFLWKELNNGDESLLNFWIRDGRLLERAFGGERRVADLRRVLNERKQQGDLLCVLSGCTKNIIIKALEFAKLDDLLPAERVFGSDTQPFGLDKSKRLDNLLEIFHRKKASLVDDDIGHCRRAVCAGHDALWVRHQCGLEAREMQRLIQSDWDSKADLGVK